MPSLGNDPRVAAVASGGFGDFFGCLLLLLQSEKWEVRKSLGKLHIPSEGIVSAWKQRNTIRLHYLFVVPLRDRCIYWFGNLNVPWSNNKTDKSSDV